MVREDSLAGCGKAIVAVEHAALIAVWNMLTNGVFYDDLGDQFYAKRKP